MLIIQQVLMKYNYSSAVVTYVHLRLTFYIIACLKNP